MKIACVFIGIFLAFINLYLGYRVNNLYRKDIYRLNKKVSLKRLRISFNNCNNEKDRRYVKATIYLYYIDILLICMYLVLIVLSFV